MPDQTQDREALRERILLAMVPTARTDTDEWQGVVVGLTSAMRSVMPVVDELRAELESFDAMLLDRDKTNAELAEKLATARSDALRANRLLTRLTEEQQHKDPDIRARVRAALEAIPATGAMSVSDFLDAATDAACAEVFLSFKSLGVALEDRDKIIAKAAAELASTREELAKAYRLADSLRSAVGPVSSVSPETEEVNQ